MHQFSNAFNMALTLNFCVLKVTGAMAFKFMLPIYLYKGPDIKIFAMLPILFGNKNASLQTGR